jgi:voltage-gated potassium channel
MVILDRLKRLEDRQLTELAAGGVLSQAAVTRRAPSTTWREFFYHLLHTNEVETKLEHWVRMAISALILIATSVVILETVPDLHKAYEPIFHAVELVCVIFFTIEYGLRVWCMMEQEPYRSLGPIKGRLRYIVSYWGVLDLIAILPFYIPHVLSIDLIVLRQLRLVRLLRILKLGEYSRSISMIERVIKSKRHDMISAILMILMLMVMCASLMYVVEHNDPNPVFLSIPHAFEWGISAFLIDGFSSVAPHTVFGRICAMAIGFLTAGFFGLPSAILASGFIAELQEKKAEHSCPNCGVSLKTAEAGVDL